MKVTGVVGTTRGSAHFGIKPYPVVVERPLCAADRTIIHIVVYTDFKAIGESEFEVDKTARYHFSPLVVSLTPQLEQLYTSLGGDIEVLKRQFLAEEEARASERERLIRRRRMKGESTCPGFEKAYDPDVIECKECKTFFPTEFEACRRACMKQAEGEGGKSMTDKEAQNMSPATAQTTQQPAAAPAPVAPPAAPQVPKEPKVTVEKKTGKYEGFREGSNADALQKFLMGKGKATVEECATYLVGVSKKPLDLKKATETVKAYLWEWKKGEWAGVKRPFPFTVKVDGANVEYTKKA
jgi:hypothetical protein